MTLALSRRRVLAGAGLLAAAPVLAAEAVALRRGHGGRLFLPVRIAGKQVEALLDSAAEMTLVDTAFAKRLGLDGGEAVEAKGTGAEPAAARIVEGVAVAAAGVDLGRIPVAVIDLSDVSKRLVGRPLQLVLGRELFDAARFEIDIAGGKLQSVTRAFEPRGTKLALTAANGTETMPILIEGVRAQAEFDLGNGTHMLVGRAFAQKHGLLKFRAIGSEAGGGIGGRKVRQTLVLKDVTIAGRTFRSVPAAIDDSDNAADANVGIAQLTAFRITADYHDRALWFRPAA